MDDMIHTIKIDAAGELERFYAMVESDKSRLSGREYLSQWLFADILAARNTRSEMNFYGFDGAEHVWKFFCWIRTTRFADYFEADLIDPLIALSAERDQNALAQLGISRELDLFENVGRYNAQDYLFQRAYPVPAHQQVHRHLEFGGGHGRAANLAFSAPGSNIELMTLVDAIPGPYLSQSAYLQALGLRVTDALEHPGGVLDMDAIAQNSDVLHIPTWRMEDLPEASHDMVSCVQVLKELPRQVALYAIGQFARILKPGGALCVRDHPQFHSPNHLPIDVLLQSSGFVLEFAPHIHDRVEVHGLPRIWRKLNPANYLQASEISAAPADPS